MTESLIKFAQAQLLQPMELEPQQLSTVLGSAISKQVDYADLFLQQIQSESWVLENGIVKQGQYSQDAGFGLRVVSGEKTGFAYADEIVAPALQQAAASARSIVHSGGDSNLQLQSSRAIKPLYTANNPLMDFADNDKIKLLQQIDQQARAADKRIHSVSVNLSASHRVVLILDYQGRLVPDVRPMVSLHLRVIAKQGERFEQGFSGSGGRYDYVGFLAQLDLDQFINKAVKQACTNLEAQPAPAGTMPVVLGPGWPAVLLHEAIGHGLEGDFNRKGTSAFSGRLGERVASEQCTVVDDGTLLDRRGSLTVDDEGMPTECTVLIENGILKNYMQDKHNAQLMGVDSTGNGRRESYAHRPIPRMTNTYMCAGKHDPQEIIASVEKGIYAVDFSGGQVDITSGKFVFCMSEAYLIENGKVTTPIKGATLIGDGPSVLTRVSMVGNDMQLDTGIGVCGKDGQSVPVGVGQPTLKVDEMVVGGAE
ncbi:MAG: metalloprotease TldD [Coxiellaceae bacterium]|nr:metalloprotease TldD [Coxiellaceae bacterium]